MNSKKNEPSSRWHGSPGTFRLDDVVCLVRVFGAMAIGIWVIVVVLILIGAIVLVVGGPR